MILRVVVPPPTSRNDGLTPAARFLERLERYRRTGDGKWQACCPAHEDHTPSLSVREEEGGLLLIHCFAGCSPDDIVTAVGLSLSDLFPPDPDWRPERQRVNGRHAPPMRDVKGAQFTLEVARATVEGGRELNEEGHRQCADAIEVLLRAGIRPEWTPEKRPDDPLPLPPSLDEFRALEFPRPDPLIGPWSTQQLSLLYAPAGVGKTMFALALAWAMSMGLNFLHWKAQRACRVLYVDGEMVAARLQGRLSGVESPDLYIANLLGWGALCGLEPVNLATSEGQAVLLDWVERLRVEVAFLDNLMSLAWVEGVSLNSDEAWQPVRRLLMELRTRGVSVVVVDHANSAGQIFGTKTKLWHVDLAARLSHMEEEDEADLARFDGQIPGSQPRFRLSWDKVRNMTDWDSANPSQGALGDTDEVVVCLGSVGQQWKVEGGDDVMRRQARRMKENGMSIREISEELEVSKSRVGRWVRGVVSL